MSGLVAVAIGGVLGAMWSGVFGMVLGAIAAWLLQRSLHQERRIAELAAALKDLQALRRAFAERDRGDAAAMPTSAAGAAIAAAEASGARPVTAVAAQVPASPADELEDLTPTVPMDEAVMLPREPTEVGAVETAAAPTQPAHDPLAPLKAWLFGGNTIVKAGIGILFVGLAFLAKYASEHVHVPVELRLAGIAAVALVLLVIGWRLRERRSAYAQVLQGGAVAVLYLTLFVAFRFYGVLAVGPVFVLMVVVAALAAALAVLQNASALALIGALGGFATPLLVSTGSGNYVALFGYYLVLDAGIAFVAWFRTWRLLNLVGFAATFIVATAWGVLKYQRQDYANSQGFLIAFFLLFVAIMLMPVRRSGSEAAASARGDAWVQGALLFGLPTIAFVLQYGLVRDTPYGVALSALVLAAFYVGLAAWMRRRPAMALAFEGSLAVGTVFLTLVIPFALDARSTAGAWAVEGAGLVWLGLRQSRLAARGFGYALLLLAGVALMHGMQRHGAPEVWLNASFFNALLVAAAALAAAWSVQRYGRTQAGAMPAPHGSGAVAHEAFAEPVLIAWATLWLLAAAAVQIPNFVDARLHLAAWLGVFSGVALLYTLLCTRLRWPLVGRPAIAHAPLHAIGALIVTATHAKPLQDGLGWAWLAALLVHALVLKALAPAWPATARTAVHTLGVLVVAGIGALQGRVITADWGDAGSAWAWLGWLAVPALLLLVLPRPALVQRWPVRDDPPAYGLWACGVLAAASLLWTLIANLASNGSARPLPHVPLLNPLDLGVGIALVGAWRWMRSAAAREALRSQPALPAAVMALAGFVWLNAMLIRGFHHYGGVPYHVDAWVHSLAVQTGLTLLWSATALVAMWLAARRGLRVPWMAGAALLAAVVLKLLLVDLSGTGTVTRIVSFIGVGILMLVIGYVAPLPSRAAKGHDATA